jgi:hypothetical protein
MSKPANPVTLPLADYSPKHFLLAVADKVATVTLNRPERKNPLTFESYRELTTRSRPSSYRARAATSPPAATSSKSSAR